MHLCPNPQFVNSGERKLVFKGRKIKSTEKKTIKIGIRSEEEKKDSLSIPPSDESVIVDLQQHTSAVTTTSPRLFDTVALASVEWEFWSLVVELSDLFRIKLAPLLKNPPLVFF